MASKKKTMAAPKVEAPVLQPPKHTQPGYQDPPLPMAPGHIYEEPVTKTSDGTDIDTATAQGLQLQLPPCRAVMVVGIREDNVPFFEVLGPQANLITAAGLIDFAGRNLSALYAVSPKN